LYWLHHAGISGQVHAIHEPAAGFTAFLERSDYLRASYSRVATIYAGVAE